ncbi:hypothetical protein H4R34_004404 [Dimargaris verticillata]|uniref:Micro-fibrillar-associated protein 1 C-terminal domain-containing protein n=1 Tax=Dimargaris verticillata TaxID=2761393 RepID=A0A9W8E857_9FUNG|nr:hypothetical protein H4R34_004404 [Dimargaris verticillata]
MASQRPTRGRAPKSRVKRYWPGKAPEGADLQNSSSSTSEPSDTEHRKSSEAEGDEWAIQSEESEDETPFLPSLSASQPAPSALLQGNVLTLPTSTETSGESGGQAESQARSWSTGDESGPDHAVLHNDEYTSSSDDDGVQAPDKPALLKPVFIPKRLRDHANSQPYSAVTAQTTNPNLDQSARKRETRQIIADRIRAEQQEAKPTSHSELQDVDDADRSDEEDAEYDLWKVRELARCERNRAEEETRLAELEEIERRRNLTEEERRREDARRQRDQQDGTTEPYRSAKIGAFYTQEHADLVNRTIEASADDKARAHLPEIMQAKNFGRSGQTKWKSLQQADTSQRDALWHRGRGPQHNLGSARGSTKDSFDRPSHRRR